jgi:hypothetical protein
MMRLFIFGRLAHDPQRVLAAIQARQLLCGGNAFVVAHCGGLPLELANKTTRLSGSGIAFRAANPETFLDRHVSIVSQTLTG